MISSTNPTVVTVGNTTTTYNGWWIPSLTIHAGNPNGAVKCRSSFVKYTRNEQGVASVSQVDGVKTYQIDDLFALAATNPEVATLVDSLITTIGALAKAAGAIN